MLTARAVAALFTCVAVAACDVPDATAPSPTAATPRAVASLALGDDATMLLSDAPGSVLEAAFAAAADTGGTPGAGLTGMSNGHFDLAASTAAIVDERYSYTARSTTFPAADGELEIHGAQVRPAIQFVVHARVECMSVLGNQAWISGRATHVLIDNQENPALVGITTSIRVQDNGEGARRPDDLATLVFFRQNSQAWCLFRPLAPMTPTANGNIQVH